MRCHGVKTQAYARPATRVHYRDGIQVGHSANKGHVVRPRASRGQDARPRHAGRTRYKGAGHGRRGKELGARSATKSLMPNARHVVDALASDEQVLVLHAPGFGHAQFCARWPQPLAHGLPAGFVKDGAHELAHGPRHLPEDLRIKDVQRSVAQHGPP